MSSYLLLENGSDKILAENGDFIVAEDHIPSLFPAGLSRTRAIGDPAVSAAAADIPLIPVMAPLTHA